MAVNTKEYYSIPEICQRWSCNEDDIWYYAEREQLVLSVLATNRRAWVFSDKTTVIGSCVFTGVVSVNARLYLGGILRAEEFECRYASRSFGEPNLIIHSWDSHQPVAFERLGPRWSWVPINFNKQNDELPEDFVFYFAPEELWWWPEVERWVPVTKLTSEQRRKLDCITLEMPPTYDPENYRFHKSDIRITEIERRYAEADIFGMEVIRKVDSADNRGPESTASIEVDLSKGKTQREREHFLADWINTTGHNHSFILSSRDEVWNDLHKEDPRLFPPVSQQTRKDFFSKQDIITWPSKEAGLEMLTTCTSGRQRPRDRMTAKSSRPTKI